MNLRTDSCAGVPPVKDFFISYNKDDRRWAEWLAWQLQEAGYTFVIQAWHFRDGPPVVQQISDALASTRRSRGSGRKCRSAGNSLCRLIHTPGTIRA